MNTSSIEIANKIDDYEKAIEFWQRQFNFYIKSSRNKYSQEYSNKCLKTSVMCETRRIQLELALSDFCIKSGLH
ncbi:hypothetical protein HWQ46_00355 [Shewanella sp. D64]|uniref:hypothetical protein n=1 Tax=unclassified Shewanella TaxID=196818 RepID=UPI0022BA3C53|nr:MULTISPECIES: hypothetical protein [unclassified Shewanella]MEC4724003.1 hypothetical protein [Shewanella sp. D64]MEC4736023.1 hypothetical protein [Shewanella sp. E94]WBJ98032.1 hypothetical protein HWQ47_13505 [Shewanella sp. MTB7]WBJ98042.1 hypothetical protein HWQ47_13555 [Shewanella sp. MTB7]